METIEAYGCSVVVRRIHGPQTVELFFHCRPPAAVTAAGRQAEAIYRAILAFLEAEGGDYGSVVTETLFLRDLRGTIESVRASRRSVLRSSGATDADPAITEIEQAPLDESACLELLAHAVLPGRMPLQSVAIVSARDEDPDPSMRTHGLRLRVGEEIRFYVGAIVGSGEGACAQTQSMFLEAEDLLRHAGMDFSDVVRTWIYLRDIDRDYGDLNRARRAFFQERGIDPVPASTGIGGGPASRAHDVCLAVYAARADDPAPRTVMTSPTLNEAMQYGADFVRGMRVEEGGLARLYVSGTASIDEHGSTVHVGDIAAQTDRMLMNMETLLGRQGAGFGDIVSAVTYLRHPVDGERVRSRMRDAGFRGFPHVLVQAGICRPDLLCETEVLAILSGYRSLPPDVA
ncbi:MAG: RidA family protein [Gammaproteobacteria bacterium]